MFETLPRPQSAGKDSSVPGKKIGPLPHPLSRIRGVGLARIYPNQDALPGRRFGTHPNICCPYPNKFGTYPNQNAVPGRHFGTHPSKFDSSPDLFGAHPY